MFSLSIFLKIFFAAASSKSVHSESKKVKYIYLKYCINKTSEENFDGILE